MAEQPQSLQEVYVTGSGPNGLAAAVELAREGLSVTLLEAADEIGGGTRTAELTLPGFRHDICSAIHPLAAASPFFKKLPLERHGLNWINPPAALAHPFDDGTAAVITQDLQETSRTLDTIDATAWVRLFSPLTRDWELLAPDLLAPLGWPKHPLAAARWSRFPTAGEIGVLPALCNLASPSLRPTPPRPSGRGPR